MLLQIYALLVFMEMKYVGGDCGDFGVDGDDIDRDS